MQRSFQANQIYLVPTTTATANTNFLVDATTGASSSNVTLSGVTAMAVTINDAYAGNTGSVVLTLAQSTSNANVWNVANAAVLTTTQLTDSLAGKLYVIVTSSAYPNEELRGQIVPTNITVTFAPMGGIQESPAVTKQLAAIQGSPAQTP